MKRIILKAMSALLAIAVAFFATTYTPVFAKAETVAETPEITQETVLLEEVPETEENGENANKNTPEITLEELLELVGKLAENEVPTDEWQAAVENIKNAISEKKIDITIVLDIIKLCIIGIAFGVWTVRKIVKKVKDKRFPDTTAQDIQDVKKTGGQLVRGYNALIEEEKQVSRTVTRENVKLDKLAAAQSQNNAALRAFIRGTALKTEIKDEALRALNKSDELCDEIQKEVKNNDDNV